MKIITIKKNLEFREIYSKGKSFANRTLVLYYRKNDCDFSRIGISVSKKVGNAVVRNRVRRLIKENIRLMDDIKQGYDLIFVVRKTAPEKDFYEIGKSIRHLFRKCNLLS